jgi:porphobilinogen deaminase
MRRKAQLLHAHPHLKVVPVRGNIDARLKMLENGELDAIVLAAAGGAGPAVLLRIACCMTGDQTLQQRDAAPCVSR